MENKVIWCIVSVCILFGIFLTLKDNLYNDCTYNKYNCSNFKTYEDANYMFRKCLYKGDIHKLDANGNFVPCETLNK